MQQHSRTTKHNPEVDRLVAEMGRILHRLAEVGPPDTVTVPLALPMELASLMVTQAEAMGLTSAHIYVSCLLHGQYHYAHEQGSEAAARDIARLIRRCAPAQEWERFLAQHPEAKEGL